MFCFLKNGCHGNHIQALPHSNQVARGVISAISNAICQNTILYDTHMMASYISQDFCLKTFCNMVIMTYIGNLPMPLKCLICCHGNHINQSMIDYMTLLFILTMHPTYITSITSLNGSYIWLIKMFGPCDITKSHLHMLIT